MEVKKAYALGTCFGVRDAISLALEFEHKEDLTILGQLVHNPQVAYDLKKSGIKMVQSIDEKINTKYVMITAHGISEHIKKQLLDDGYYVQDASCPLVVRVHKAIRKLVRDGYFPVVIGQKEHVEVRGIVGDLKEYEIILKEEDISRLDPHKKIGIVSQTTQPIKSVLKIVEGIKKYTQAKVKFVDTVCQPTKDRQKAIEDLCKEVDIVMVIGGFNSSNTKKLKDVSEKKGLRTHHIEGISNIKKEWFLPHDRVGISAGTSTPSHIIDEVYKYLQDLKI